jgi:DNA-binding MarR family transcriptional regulator
MAIEPATKTAQNQVTVSINRKAFKENMVLDDQLTLKDWRIYGLLLTHLDAKQYKSIDCEKIADTLGYKKKQVRNSIDHLIERGKLEIDDSESSETVKHGLRFTF